MTTDGNVYWATDTQYTFYYASERRKRRDIVTLTDCENVHVRQPDGSVSVKTTRLCCEIVFFIKITGLKIFFHSRDLIIPEKVRSAMDEPTDSVTCLVGRYFSPHPEAVDRDLQKRPICPGPLKLNHCLWTYAVAARARQILLQPNGQPTTFFNDQGYMFGSDPAQQRRRLLDETHAYLCIHFTSEIHERAQMSREYRDDTLTYSDVWLQSIVLV